MTAASLTGAPLRTAPQVEVGGCAAPIESLALTAASSSGDLEQNGASWYPNIAYGAGPRQLLDVLVPASAESTPIAVFIRGGGFTGRHKGMAYNNRC